MSKNSVFDSEIASHYDETLPAHVSAHYLEKRRRFFSRYIRPHAKVLDVGCGTGVILSSLLSVDKAIDPHGCDNSIDMLEKGNRRSGALLTCGMSDRLPYKENTFDLVISVAVFHHLGSEETAANTIREMMRVTKHGGASIIWDANPMNPYWLLLFKRVPYDRVVKCPMPLTKIVSDIRDAGIAKIEMINNGWIPDFAPKKMMGIFKVFESLMERVPFLNIFSAHNVVILTKRA